jgi:hypothetical protein
LRSARPGRQRPPRARMLLAVGQRADQRVLWAWLTLAIQPGAFCLMPMIRSVLIRPDGSTVRSSVSTETTCVAYGFGYFRFSPIRACMGVSLPVSPGRFPQHSLVNNLVDERFHCLEVNDVLNSADSCRLAVQRQLCQHAHPTTRYTDQVRSYTRGWSPC